MRWVCRMTHRFLPEVAAGVALPPIAWWVRRHVVRCPKCARLWRQHERLTRWLQRASLERATPPGDLWQRTVAQLPERQPSTARLRERTPVAHWWQGAIAVGVVGLSLVGVWLWRRSSPSPPLPPATVPPDAFVTAVLHQHIAVTAPSPFNNPTFTAGIVAGGEGR